MRADIFVPNRPQIRMKLAGEISVGSWVQEQGPVHMLANPPTTLIYGRTEARKLSVIGAFPKATLRAGENPEFSNDSGPERCPTYFPQASFAVNFSTAPLDKVTVAKVFHQAGSSCCRGLLFEYQNGARRALGDCRVGVDPYETYETPRTLGVSVTSDWTTNVMRELRQVTIHFTDQSISNDGGEEEVLCCTFYEMKGILRFWFDHQQSLIEVLPN